MSVSLGDTFFKGDEFKDSMGDYSDLISICPSPAQTVSQSTSHAVRQSSDLCTPQSRGGFDRDVDRALSPQNPNPNPNALQMLQELYAKSRCVCHPPPACLTVRQSVRTRLDYKHTLNPVIFFSELLNISLFHLLFVILIIFLFLPPVKFLERVIRSLYPRRILAGICAVCPRSARLMAHPGILEVTVSEYTWLRPAERPLTAILLLLLVLAAAAAVVVVAVVVVVELFMVPALVCRRLLCTSKGPFHNQIL